MAAPIGSSLNVWRHEEPEMVALSTASGQQIGVLKKDVEAFKKILESHPQNLYGAYSADAPLFERLMPLWASPPDLAKDVMTDDQSRVVFPFLERAIYFNLRECPNLTGESLQSLPDGTKHLVCPKNTTYMQLMNLRNVRNLFAHELTGEKFDLRHMMQLERLEIPTPEARFGTFLPQNLEHLFLHEGEVYDDERLPQKLRTLGLSKVKIGDRTLHKQIFPCLKALYLTNIDSITDEFFKDIPETLTIYVCNCPRLGKEMLSKMPNVVIRDVN